MIKSITPGDPLFEPGVENILVSSSTARGSITAAWPSGGTWRSGPDLQAGTEGSEKSGGAGGDIWGRLSLPAVWAAFPLVPHDPGSVLAVKGSLRRFAPWTAPGRSEGRRCSRGERGGLVFRAERNLSAIPVPEPQRRGGVTGRGPLRWPRPTGSPGRSGCTGVVVQRVGRARAFVSLWQRGGW